MSYDERNLAERAAAYNAYEYPEVLARQEAERARVAAEQQAITDRDASLKRQLGEFVNYAMNLGIPRQPIWIYRCDPTGARRPNNSYPSVRHYVGFGFGYIFQPPFPDPEGRPGAGRRALVTTDTGIVAPVSSYNGFLTTEERNSSYDISLSTKDWWPDSMTQAAAAMARGPHDYYQYMGISGLVWHADPGCQPGFVPGPSPQLPAPIHSSGRSYS